MGSTRRGQNAFKQIERMDCVLSRGYIMQRGMINVNIPSLNEIHFVCNSRIAPANIFVSLHFHFCLLQREIGKEKESNIHISYDIYTYIYVCIGHICNMSA